MIQAPIFHVNGDDPEAVLRVAQLAFEYRQAFNKDVVIDMVCYRRRGHNEGDDPSMTNPRCTRSSTRKRIVRKIYTEALIGRGDITVEEAEEALRDYHSQLEQVFNEVRELEKHAGRAEPVGGVRAAGPGEAADRRSPREVLQRIGDAHVEPAGRLHPAPAGQAGAGAPGEDGPRGRHRLGLRRAARVRLAAHGGPTGPARRPGLAARHVRAAARGAHRPQDRRRSTCRCRTSPTDQGRFLVYDSALSEYAAMGFEYGYSVANPDALVLWEAQFGDFVNGAQSVIDEFISSGEAKWGQHSDVVMLLPHGHEGQGPDHTSGPHRALPAAVRRGLDDGRGAVHPGELLPPAAPPGARRRGTGRWSCSRRSRCCATRPRSARSRTSPRARSSSVIDDRGGHRPGAGAQGAAVSRQALLRAGRRAGRSAGSPTSRSCGSSSSTRCRSQRLGAIFERYPNATDFRWVQEEPANQGAWPFYGLHLPELYPDLPRRDAGSPAGSMAAPSAGSGKVHEVEQREIIEKALS